MKNESVLLTLQRATHVTQQVLTARLADLELSASEINALGNLTDGAGRTTSALAAAAGVRSATLTGILDRLERRGLVTRGARPGDRRAVLVALTADGRAAAGQIRHAMRTLERRALAHVDPEAVASARTVLAALTEVTR